MRNHLWATVLFCCVLGSARADEGLPADTLQALKAATVFVKVEAGALSGSGSGFLIRTDGESGYVVTNHHVIAPRSNEPVGVPILPGRRPFGPGIPPLPAPPSLKNPFAMAPMVNARVSVVFWSGTAKEKSAPAEVLGGDARADLAVLRVTGIRGLPSALDADATPKVAETMPVYVLGFPFGQLLTERKGKNPPITVGKASVSSLHTGDDGELDSIQLDGTLNPGNSGGPVVDSKGRLIGIARSSIVSKKEGNTNISKAIPARTLKGLLAGSIGQVRLQRMAKDKTGQLKVELDLFDPFEKVHSVQLYYCPDPAKAGAPGSIAAVPGAKKVALKIDKHKAVATIDLDVPEKDAVLALQAEYINATGRKLWTPIQTTRPAVEAAKVVKSGPVQSATPVKTITSAGKISSRVMPPLPPEMLAIVRSLAQREDRTRTNVLGFTIGDVFEESPAAGGVLIGFEVGLGKFLQNDVIHSLRPIFWTEKGEMFGEIHGQPGERAVAIVAKDGYAIAGMAIKRGLHIDSMKITFMRMGKGCLDPADRYESELIGGEGGQVSGSIGGDGSLVVGICVREVQNHCRALGLVMLKGTHPQIGGQPLPTLPMDTLAFLRKSTGSHAKTDALGFPHGELFEQLPPSEGILVGFEVSLGKFANTEFVHALTPIFWTEKGVVLGRQIGQPGLRTVVVRAKHGYAVAGLEIKSALFINSIKVNFMRVNKEALDPKDSYQSEMVGGEGGHAVATVGGSGALVVGICGKTNQNQCRALGLLMPGDRK